MKRPSITPGPWTSVVPPASCQVHRFIDSSPDDEPSITLAEVGGNYSSGVMPGLARITASQHTANAKAIAAVPELLAALETFPEFPDDFHPSNPDAVEAFAEAVTRWKEEQARQALHKAGYEFP